MSRLSRIKQDAPDKAELTEVVDLAEQADKLQDLKALHDTDGGKVLVRLLLTDVVNNVKRLCSSYRSATHVELMATIASIESNLDTAKLLIGAEEGMKVLDAELEDALRE